MVILIRSYGNHSNRLFQNLHFEAFCLEHGIPYFNATIPDLAKVFGLHYRNGAAFFYRLFFGIVRLLKLDRRGSFPYVYTEESGRSEKYGEQLLNGRDRLVFAGGWGFRAYDLVLKHSDHLRKKYSTATANEQFHAAMDRFPDDGIILGVHIRRGDYQRWLGGRFFYDDLVYRRIVKDFTDLHPQKKVHSIYFSDEALDGTIFRDQNEGSVSNNEYYIDYQLMGKCNFLIGPPSTATAWASFIYHVPCLHIESAGQQISMKDFKIFREG